MKHTGWILSLLIVGVLSVPVAVQQNAGTDDTGPYTPVVGWLKPLRAGFELMGAYGVFAESPNRIFGTYIAEYPVVPAGTPANAPAPKKAADHMVLVLDGNGKTVDEWKQFESLFVTPHYITESPYDPDKAIWIADRNGSQLFKFSNDGKKLLMTIGEKGVEKSDETHFGRCASIAFLPDGSFYVADGYVNKRVVKFDKNGKFLFQWGSVGSGPGQFAANGQVHAVAIGADRKIYVGDRGNRRVQVFDENGKYLSEWDDIQGPSDIKITQDGYAWIVSGVGNRVAKFDLKGKLITYWGMYGTFPGAFVDPHFASLDSAGNLYVAISSGARKAGIERYVPRPNADKTRLYTPFVVPK